MTLVYGSDGARRRHLIGAGILAACALIPRPGDAQRSVPTGSQVCEGRRVTSIEVDANRPAFRGALAWWRKLARAFGLHHATTDDDLIRRFVTLEPGMICTEFRRSESERILRVQPFLSDATVTAIPDGDGVRIHVSTVDEVPVVVGARIAGSSIRAANIGTMNFIGAGMHVEGRWERQRGLRTGVGGKVVHRQLLGHPYTFAAEGMRRSLGENYSVSLSHPFYTDLQRIAWHSGYSILKDYVRLRRPDRSQLLQPVDRAMWNVGGVIRIGPPRRLVLVGGMVLGERIVPRHEFSFIDSTSGRVVPTNDTAGVRRYRTYDATHVAGVLGVRALTYSRMKGLDALAAEQDVATGTQISSTFGIQPWFRNPLREALASVDAYVAGRSRRSFAGARVELESRVDLERRDWEHLLASGRAAWYFLPRERWVSELSVEGAAGWRTIVPNQIELGDRQGGVRGYAGSREPGGQRLLARLEQRFDLARYQRDRAALGAAAFADAGRVWSGDVPFGVTTPVRTSLGIAVLAAVPARSQRTIRVEGAFPLARLDHVGPELRFTVREPMRGFWFDPPRIRWSRLAAVPEQIFTWP